MLEMSALVKVALPLAPAVRVALPKSQAPSTFNAEVAPEANSKPVTLVTVPFAVALRFKVPPLIVYLSPPPTKESDTVIEPLE